MAKLALTLHNVMKFSSNSAPAAALSGTISGRERHNILSMAGRAFAVSGALLMLVSACQTQKQAAKTTAPGGKTASIEIGNAVVPPAGGPLRPEAERVFDLVHTRLELEPVWEKAQMRGIATLTLQPHFYPQNRLDLDAKGMEVRSVKRLSGKRSVPLQFNADSAKLRIGLDSTFTRNQKLVLEIDYTSKPNDLKRNQLAAITDDRGLYFINPLGTTPGRSRMLWTQGEPESSCAWFPTLDSPNQKFTQEIIVTVDDSLTTLSNGALVSSTRIAGSKRIDHWELDKPHAPYLAMLAVGPFAVVKDKWKDKEVSYYVEKPYKGWAKKIFGNTPEMIEFFSQKLNYPYPWNKYSQILVRDYVSGAMENTTATIHMEELLIDETSHIDQNWDAIIAHELFHQWFGDLATAESWSNLSLNESWANYSEQLWAEYKGGRDAGDRVALEEKAQYFWESRYKQEPIIRPRYVSPNDMFDSHSYAKGGRVLHMLRHEIGDEAFFTAMSTYLKKFAYKKAEIHDLRLVFEEVTGRDLNWFFDQWFHRPGHPELRVRKTFSGDELLISVSQLQDTTYTPIYKFSFDVDVWQGGERKRHRFFANGRDSDFSIPITKAPSLVQFDPDNYLLAMVDESHNREELVHQMNFAPLALSRAIAADRVLREGQPAEQNVYFKKALRDTSYMVREAAMEIALNPAVDLDNEARDQIARMAFSDPKSAVREAAVGAIGQLKIQPMVETLARCLEDKSYAVQAEALNQIVQSRAGDVDQYIKRFEKSAGPPVLKVVAELYGSTGLVSNLPWLKAHMYDMNKGVQYSAIKSIGEWTLKTKPENRELGYALLEELAGYTGGNRNLADGLGAAFRILKDDPRIPKIAAKAEVGKRTGL